MATPFYFFSTKRYGNSPTGNPNGSVECKGCKKIENFNQYLALSRKRYKIGPRYSYNLQWKDLLKRDWHTTLSVLAKYTMTQSIVRSLRQFNFLQWIRYEKCRCALLEPYLQRVLGVEVRPWDREVTDSWHHTTSTRRRLNWIADASKDATTQPSDHNDRHRSQRNPDSRLPLEISPRHIRPRTITLLFTWCRTFPPPPIYKRPTVPLTCTKLIAVDRLESGVWVSASLK